MRVRSFGFLANACKAKNIAIIRDLLSGSEQINDAPMIDDLLPTQPLNKTLVIPDEKPFIKAITSDDINALQPSENLVANALVSPSTGINDAGNIVIPAKEKESVAELMKRITGIDIERCKHCKVGRLEKTLLLPGANSKPETRDTS
jgi:hypothetical protein